MKDDFSETRIENGTIKSIYDYTPDEKKWINWAVAAGTIIGTFPFNWIYVKFGAKIPFLIAGIISIISTSLIPCAAQFHFISLLFIRFLQGIAYSADFAVVGIITIRWAPINETTFFLAALTCFTGISSWATNSMAGLVCESFLGWRGVFYIHSIVGILFVLWIIFYIENPQNTQRLSEKELLAIKKDKSSAHLQTQVEVPYKKIITSPVILMVWLNSFIELATIIFFTTYMPIYFRQVLAYSIRETGFYVGLFLGASMPVRIIVAIVCDKLTIISESWKIAIYNTIAVGIFGAVAGSIGFFPPEHRFLVFLLCAISVSLASFNTGGFYKCATFHARQFAHVVIAAIQFTKCLALFVAPTLVAFFVDDEGDRSQWIPIFLIFGTANFVINIISLFIFTDEPAEWTLTEDEKYQDQEVEDQT